ncbi:MAG: hypothetical protein ACRES7_05490 [Gammaproteobacteria bacterium]
MLISEVKGWYYFISWDNPVPADSSSMLTALKRLGKVTTLQTKTSIALAPKKTTTWRHVRAATRQNLHQKRGNAFYVNLRSGLGFQIGKKTNYLWKKV